MPRPSNTKVRREQIIQALLQVMAKTGYEKASIQNIAKAAGLSSGLIHYHFKTKQEILIELIDTISELVQCRYEAFLKQAKTPKDQLFAFINARLSKGQGSSPSTVAAWVVIGAEAVRQPEVKEVYQKSIDAQLTLLTKLLSATAQEASVKKSKKELKQFSAMLLATIEGAFQLSSAASDVMPKDYAATTVSKSIECFLMPG